MLLTRTRPVLLLRDSSMDDRPSSDRTRMLPRCSPGHSISAASAAAPSNRPSEATIPTPPPPATTVTVRTTTALPSMTSLGPFPGQLLLGLYSTDTRSSEHVIEVRYNGSRVVCDNDPGSYAWMAYIQPARDRHEQNLESLRDSHGRIHFRCVRDVAKGEELYVWYGREMAQQSEIPVLAPAHIRGDQEYMCTKCLRSFRYPNVLKAHMRFHCPSLNDFGAAGYGMMSRALWQPMGQPPPAHMHSRVKSDNSLAEHPNGPPRMHHPDIISAFKPHRRSAGRSSPYGSPGEATPRTRSRTPPGPAPGQDGHETNDEQQSSTQSSPQCSPTSTQMSAGTMRGLDFFNPAAAALGHLRPFLVPPYLDKMAAAGLSHYNPMYSRLYNSLPHCCSTSVPSSVSLHTASLADSAAALYHLYGFHPNPLAAHSHHLAASDKLTRPSSLTSELSNKRPLVTSSTDSLQSPGPHPMGVTAFNFPMPSDKAGEPLDLLPKSIYTNKSRKGHLCIYCGKLYSRKYGLKIHLRTHTGYKPLKCKVCLRPFGDPSNLNKHIRLHAEGETPYRCQYCGKVLVRRRDLERHIRSRHPDGAVDDENEALPINDVVCDSAPDSSDGDADVMNDSFDEATQDIEVEV